MGDSKAMNNTHGSPFAHVAVCMSRIEPRLRTTSTPERNLLDDESGQALVSGRSVRDLPKAQRQRRHAGMRGGSTSTMD